jgi:glycolate oxidase FAD binding subunit
LTTTTPSPSAGATVERPAGVAEAAEVLRGGRGAVLFRGGGTKMSWGNRPRPLELVLETGGLDRLLAHNPADMTAAVQAGMPLRALQDHLASSGQWLALDPPSEAAGATLGGLLATGDSGPRRLRYGALRDLVIGVTLVLADGTVARAGGYVIKNVAGYDLSKLMYGSLGTLALVAEVVVRVHPRPQTSATVVVPASARAAARTAVDLLAAPLEPAAVDWTGGPGDAGSPGGSGDRAGAGRLAVRFEGSAAGVAAQTAALYDLVGGSGSGAEQLVSDGEAQLWQELAAAHRGRPGESVAVAGTLPDRLPAVADALVRAGDSAGASVRLASHAALGLHAARLAGPAQAQVRAFDAWREAVLALGGNVLLRDRPDEVDALVDAVGPPPSAVNLMRSVKGRLDPHGRLAPGRLGDWL